MSQPGVDSDKFCSNCSKREWPAGEHSATVAGNWVNGSQHQHPSHSNRSESMCLWVAYSLLLPGRDFSIYKTAQRYYYVHLLRRTRTLTHDCTIVSFCFISCCLTSPTYGIFISTRDKTCTPCSGLTGPPGKSRYYWLLTVPPLSLHPSLP